MSHPLKIALIGATGRVGQAILAEALERGHQVTAISRSASKLAHRPGLIPVDADVYGAAATAQILKGQDAVISAFNPGWADPDIRAKFNKGFAAIVDAIKAAGVKRALFVGGAGSLKENGKRIIDGDFNPKFKDGALGAADSLDTIKAESGFDWSFVSPAKAITAGARTAKYRHGLDEPVKDAEGKSEISMADLAHAIVDEIETPRHTGRRFTVGY